MKRHFAPAAGYLFPLALLILTSCAGNNEQPREAAANHPTEPTPVAMATPVSSPVIQLGPSPTKAESAPPPNPDEVKSAVTRVFYKAAAADLSTKPAFIVGDFNGDGSQDLAVLIKPNEGQLAEINNELANWVLEDPKNITRPKANGGLPIKPVRAEKEETLLAVIHGAGPQGWRNPDAKQTYLLKNEGASNMNPQAPKTFKADDKQKLPEFRGDLINETRNGKPGILYWNGAKYGWISQVSK